MLGRGCVVVLGLLAWAVPVAGENIVFERFDNAPEQRWGYVSDGVMGGVSQGGAVFGQANEVSSVHLQGVVSTQNNGGVIQVRRLLPDALPVATSGLTLTVRGNGETYYLFVRTKDMTRPWYYYNASFVAGPEWTQVSIPLDALQPSHAHLAERVDPEQVISIGLVAYGRDHDADLRVSQISLF